VRIESIPGVDRDADEKWRTGAVRALVRHLQGHVTLHASAVAIEGVALVFLGDSGAGKSTLAASLCTDGAADLLADDLAEIEREHDCHVVRPSESAHWLLCDSAEALGYGSHSARKQKIVAHVPASPARLGAVVQLSFDACDSPSLSPLRGSAAFAGVSAAYVRFAVDDARVSQRDLHVIANLLASVPAFTLHRARSLRELSPTGALLRRLVRELATTELTS
jgi:hypothetical protein